MAYITRFQDKLGNVSMERVNDGVRRRVTATQARIAPKLHKCAKDAHKSARKMDAKTNGFSPERVFRRIARIPKKALRAYHGECPRGDMKALKSFVRDKGFNTVPSNSF